MTIQLVNVGVLPNDGEGDPLRVAFQKINNNFVYLQQTSTNITNAVTVGDDPNQIIFEYPADEFTQAMLQIQSYREDNNDSQNALFGVQIYNDGTDVKYTIYGISNVGDWLTQYSMDILNGNVRLLVSPLQDQVIQHFIAYQVTYAGDLGLGIPMTSESGEILITENDVNINTES
jgi:hypothetical protein